jgi:hypothetical protein
MTHVLTFDDTDLLGYLPTHALNYDVIDVEDHQIMIGPPPWPALVKHPKQSAWADQSGGAPSVIQQTFNAELQSVSDGRLSRRSDTDTVIVLTLNGETYLDDWPSQWGDGHLYICMTRHDLQASKWSRAIAFSQRD